MITLVLCCDLNGNIGNDNELIYHVKGDMKNFKELTEGKTVIMGYNTWESLPTKPLPNRNNVILTSKDKSMFPKGVSIIRSIDDIKLLAEDEDVIVIGGAKLVNDLIEEDLIDEAYLTIVYRRDVVANKSINVNKLASNLYVQTTIKMFAYEPFISLLSKWERVK